MAKKKQAAQTTGGRQAAYTARNRASLLKAGQEVLAKIGPQATLEQLSEHAQVSPTTIYKYFGNKEVLFSEAFSQAWENWIEWSNQVNTSRDRLERTLDTGRKLFWVKRHNPFFAQILHNALKNPAFAIMSVRAEGERVFKELATSGVISNEDFKERIILWSNIFIGLLVSIYVTEEISPAEAEIAFGIGLSIWGISEAKAKKLTSRPLEFSAGK